MADPQDSTLNEELGRTLDGLFARRVVLGATPFLSRFPWPLRAVCFSGGLFALTLAAGTLLSEPRVLRQIDLWAGLLLLVCLLAYERLAVDIKRVVASSVAPTLSSGALAQARTWSTTHVLLTHQAAICSGIGLLTAACVAIALQWVFGRQGPATLLFLAFGSALVTSLIYIPASVSVLSLVSAAGHADVFPLDPARSRLVAGLRRLGQGTVVASAAMGTVGALGPLLLPGLGAVAYVLAALVLCGAISASVAQFFVQQHALGTLIMRARNGALGALQSDIAPLFARRTELSDREQATLTSLLALYDRVVSISAKGFSARETLRFIRPLLIPAVTMILTTLHIQMPTQGIWGQLLRQLLKQAAS